MVRLGRNRDGWAKAMPGVTSLLSNGRQMPGWVRVSRELCADEATRHRFLEAALAFTGDLPPR